MDLIAAIGSQQFKTGAETIHVVNHDAMQSGPKLVYHSSSNMVGFHDLTNGIGSFWIGLDTRIAVLYVFG